MNRTLKAIAVLMLMMVFAVGCTSNKHDYVDLGLPSGTLWATSNVGASNPEGYGNYYAWGETTIKSNYNWGTYKYANGDIFKLTKYCNESKCGENGFIDNLTTLQDSDDSAMVNWGSEWSTPTDVQWEELMNNTTNKWAVQNGVNGWLFTAANGNNLFLPAAGFQYDDELREVGDYGNYLSSSFDIGVRGNVWYFDFSPNGCQMHSDFDRGCGRPVRAVRAKK